MPAPTQRFSNKVDNYVKYRPSYPAEVLDHLAKEATLSNESLIADVGSGTGIFSSLLLDKGYTVYSVEPNQPMRESADVQLASFAKFHSVNGSAEATTLPDNSVDLIVCAQAFHWFDQANTRVEFHRILKPGGKVALIWNKRKLDVDDFAVAYEQLLQEQGTDYKETNLRNITDAAFSKFFKNGKYQLTKFSNIQIFDEDGLIGRSFSSSFIPQQDTEAGQVFLESVKQVFSQYQVNGKVNFEYETEVYLGEV